MSEIEKMIEELCPDGAEWKELGDAVAIKTGKNINKSTIADSPGPYPVINSGREPLGFVDIWNTENDPIGVTSRGAGVGSITWCDGKYYRGNLNYSVTVNDLNEIDNRFLYYLLLNMQTEIQNLATFNAIPALNASSFKKLKIPVPPVEVQRKIVDILDKFTQLEAELEAELEARKKQYEFYRDQLLTFDEGGVEWKPLGEMGEFVRGSSLQKKHLTEAGFPAIHYGQIYTSYGMSTNKTKSFVSKDFAKKSRKAKYGDLVIATTSENDEDVCKAVVWLGDEEVAVSNDACFYSHDLDPKYVGYFFETSIFQKQKKIFITGTKVKRVNASNLAKIKIPLPPLEEQKRIVAILDKFNALNALTTDIREGLPAEIEARKKQYEYYRNKLLTFSEKVHA